MNKKKAANYIQDLGALIALVLLIVVIGAISPEFRTVGNFLSLLRQSSINGLIAFGMTCVILTGGIDLSVGSVLALTTALCAGFISGGMPVGLAMILALVIGRQLYTESGRKRKLLSHSDSGHLVFTDFCDLLIRTAENNFRTSYLCDRKQCKSSQSGRSQY